MLGAGLAALFVAGRDSRVGEQRLQESQVNTASASALISGSGQGGLPETAEGCPRESQLVIVNQPAQSATKIFSARELQVLTQIAAGATSVEIAEHLNISVHTVKNHRKNILRKADCRNSGQLITRCLALGVI
ncbi:response regulator transcription factor [Microbulbifer mangrovi]|uniref:response regulator transcription factor n=1 Tax=Microbulbifer mangrovi TaxID=927787 RepID=UPI0009908536|nr:helix-turn-helix transcriptional regulator [Microbulbifer mangrovi]